MGAPKPKKIKRGQHRSLPERVRFHAGRLQLRVLSKLGGIDHASATNASKILGKALGLLTEAADLLDRLPADVKAAKNVAKTTAAGTRQ